MLRTAAAFISIIFTTAGTSFSQTVTILDLPAEITDLDLGIESLSDEDLELLMLDIVIEEDLPTLDLKLCEGLELNNPGFGFGAQDFNNGCPTQIILQNKGLSPDSYQVTQIQIDPPVAMDIAQLRALDKLTGRFTDLALPIGIQANFETIRIEAFACYKNPETETPESASYLAVMDTITGEDRNIFKGWMYASSPSLNAMEHAIYDVWVVDCTN